MKLNQLTRLAKDAIDKRGGMDTVKQDLQEARHAASGHDSLLDKARAAAGAFKQPGRDRGADAGGAGDKATGPPSDAHRTPGAGHERPDPMPAADQEPPRARS